MGYFRTNQVHFTELSRQMDFTGGLIRELGAIGPAGKRADDPRANELERAIVRLLQFMDTYHGGKPMEECFQAEDPFAREVREFTTADE